MAKSYDAVKMFGAYVANLSTSIGWGGQGGTMQLRLVEDPPNGVVISRGRPSGTPQRDSQFRLFDKGGGIFGWMDGTNDDGTINEVTGEIFGGVENIGDILLEQNADAMPPDDGWASLGTIGSPRVGDPVYFKYGGFYFGGLFQRHSYSESVGGGRTYDIVLESPSSIMDGVQLIVGSWDGSSDYFLKEMSAFIDHPLSVKNQLNQGSSSTNLPSVEYPSYISPGTWKTAAHDPLTKYEHINNVYNLFGFFENPQFPSPSNVYNPDFHINPARGSNKATGLQQEGGRHILTDAIPNWFGNSNFNSAGVEVDRLLRALGLLAVRIDDDGYTVDGRDRFVGPFGGPINFNDHLMELDISNLQEIVGRFWGFTPQEQRRTSAYRVKGPVMSVNSLISDIAEVLQLDYFYDIVPDVTNTEVIRPVGDAHDLSHGGVTADDPSIDGTTLDNEVTRNQDTDSANYATTLSQAIQDLPDGGEIIPLPVIKVRVVNKRQQPEAGVIEKYITQEKKKGNIISYNIGKEYGQTVTQKLVFGGRRTRYQTIGSAWAIPVWGKLNNVYNLRLPPYLLGVPAVVSPFSANYLLPVQLEDPNNVALSGVGRVSYYTATIFELRMALGGKGPWEIFKTFETLAQCEPNGFNNLQTCPWTGSFDATKDVLRLLAQGKGNPTLLLSTNAAEASKAYRASANAKADKIYQAVANVANNFYCQEYMVPLQGEFSTQVGEWTNPFAQKQMEYAPPEDFFKINAWEISDSAYMDYPLCLDLKFFDGTGKQKAMAAWNLGPSYDYSNLGSDYALGVDKDAKVGDERVFPAWPAGTGAFANKIVSTKGSPSKELYWDNTANSPFPMSGLHFVHFKAGAQIRAYDTITTPQWGLTVLAKYFFGLDVPPKNYFKGGGKGIQFEIPPDCLPPYAFGIPQESMRYNYGPWITLPPESGGNAYKGGKAEVVQDDSLRPEEFGGYANLAAIGALMAKVGVGKPTEDESGTVEVAGAPIGSLGDRFQEKGPYLTDLSISIDATAGVKSTYKFNTWTPNFGKLAKYNIDRIARINKAAWSYAQAMKDRVEKTPPPKFKFSSSETSNKKREMDMNALWTILKKYGYDSDNGNRLGGDDQRAGQQGGAGQNQQDANFGEGFA